MFFQIWNFNDNFLHNNERGERTPKPENKTNQQSNYQCCSTVHVPGVLMAVRTEIHTTRDTRKWPLVVVPNAALEALFFLPYLELERCMFRDLHPNSLYDRHTL